MIAFCPKCKQHEFQDKTYGINMRVFNPMKNSSSFRCTICLATINIKKDEIKK